MARQRTHTLPAWRRRKGQQVGLSDLSSILWREREMLELLLFKLEEEQLILASGRGRWLAHATREVEVVLDQIRRTEVVRAAEVEVIGAQLGLGHQVGVEVRVEPVAEQDQRLGAQLRHP